MQQLWFMERVLVICVHTLGISTDEMRLRNYIRKDEMPYTTPNGCVYDSGDYAGMLALAKKLIGWDAWKKNQAEARKQGRWLGIGICSPPASRPTHVRPARTLSHSPPPPRPY